MGCRTTDFILSRSLRSPQTAPFIGLVTLKPETQRTALAKTRDFLNGSSGRIRPLFRKYPYVAAWFVTHALSEAYGDDDHAIYRHIEQLIGVQLGNQASRRSLFEGFCEVCEKLDLPTRGLNRMVDVYLLHAGVPIAQLPHLIDAFLRQEAAFGLPPDQSTALLNAWEDNSMDFLPSTIVVPRRAVLWDDTAWHAALFAKIRRNQAAYIPQSPFESRFFEILQERQRSSIWAVDGSGTRAFTLPRPRLVWRVDGLALRLPKAQGRLQLWQDDAVRPLRLRGGEDWMLPQPWPNQLRWQVGEQVGTVSFLSAPTAFSIFDKSTGYVAKEVGFHDSNLEVDAAEAIVLAREEFSIDGEPSLEVGDQCFVGFVRLKLRPIKVKIKDQVVSLRARPRRRLTFYEGLVASGPEGPMFGPTTRLQVETDTLRSEMRQLRAQIGPDSGEIDIEVTEGFGEIGLENLLLSLPDRDNLDPVRLRVELLAAGESGESRRGSGVMVNAWIWPGFTESDGFVFKSVSAPSNFVLDQSRHVGRDEKGHLCLDPSGGFLAARAVFEIGGSYVRFDFPWPDVALLRNRSDGSSIGFPTGARLTVSEENRFETITIRCPDPKASLNVRGRREKSPFALGMSRSLAVRDLLSPATDDTVMLRRSNGSEVLLFELVPSVAPVELRFLPTREAIRLRLRLSGSIDAIALEVQDEQGETTFAAVGLGRHPVESRRPAWLEANLPNGDPREVELIVGLPDGLDGAALARIFVRPANEMASQTSWRPLRNVRGDTYAFALMSLEDSYSIPGELVQRFETISHWLADCYAVECWPRLEGRLLPRWKRLGSNLLEASGGRAAVMVAAAGEPPEHTATSWLPIVHPIQMHSDLYAGATSDFVPLSGAPEAGLREIAGLHALGQKRLRDQRSELHEAVYLAFQNSQEAINSDQPLKGFEPHRFFNLILALDSDPSAGWFWRGTPLLGPQHWRAAHLQFVERLEAVGLFSDEEAQDGPNSRREVALHRLIRAAWETTPVLDRPTVPKRSPSNDEPDVIDLWAVAALSGFARASRMGETEAFIAALCSSLDRSKHDVLVSLSLLLRLAPELFSFFLLVWQIAKDRP